MLVCMVIYWAVLKKRHFEIQIDTVLIPTIIILCLDCGIL
jgi:hypothetical protein